MHAAVAALNLGLKGGQPVEDMRQAFENRRVSFVTPSLQPVLQTPKLRDLWPSLAVPVSDTWAGGV